MLRPVLDCPSGACAHSAQSESVLQTTTYAIKRMLSGCVSIFYVPSKWLFDTVYYYLIGYGEGAQAPSSWSWTYSNEDLKNVYWKGTKPILDAGSYEAHRFIFSKAEPHVDLKPLLEKSAKGTEKQGTFWRFSVPFKDQGHQTKIEVVNRDALYAAKDLKAQGFNPVVLNPANAHEPGGGYKAGARAMEEDICRRSGLSFAIDREHGKAGNFYPLGKCELLYTPDCPVFRYGRDWHYGLMPTPETVSFITSAAIDLRHEERYRNDHAKFLDRSERRIYSQLWKAAEKGHDAVVLTAWGCGAFENDPKEIAAIYKNVIDTYFKGVFKKITFAIIDDHNTGRKHNPEGNFNPFYDTFKT